MRNLFILTLIFINTINTTLAQELILSDRIREAREAAKKEQIKEKVSNIKPINIKKKENAYNPEKTMNKEQKNFTDLQTVP